MEENLARAFKNLPGYTIKDIEVVNKYKKWKKENLNDE